MGVAAAPHASIPTELRPFTWRVGFGTRTGTIYGEPTRWQRLSLNLRLDDACDATVSCQAQDIDPSLIVELATDMWLWLGDTLLFRGRITGMDDNLGSEAETVTIRAIDYRGLLARRYILEGDTLNFSMVDQAEIAWTLVNQSQGHTGGALGITRGIIPAGRARNRLLEYGQQVDDAIVKLSEVVSGFEWEVSPTLKLNIYNPYRGVVTGVNLEWGVNVAAVERRSSSAEFANLVRLKGGKGAASRQAWTANLATAPEGRWELSVDDPDLLIQTTVEDRVAKMLAEHQSRPDAYVLTVVPGHFPGLALGVGDWATLTVRGHRLNVAERVRVTEIAFDADADGGYVTKLAAIRDV